MTQVNTSSLTDPGPGFTIVVPTFCERDNVEELVTRLYQVLGKSRWEVIFVDDDSPDCTADTARAIAQRDTRVRCLHRVGRRGLSSAVIEGALASSAPYIVVMDADLQHDEKLVPEMIAILQRGEHDIVVGSRYMDGGSLGEWSGSRTAISRFATKLSRLVLKADLSDPMSGFFAIRRDSFMATTHSLSGIGFKILLDILASSKEPMKYVELPYTFRTRQMGESKLDNQVVWDYVMLLLDKLVGNVIPVRFIAFALVGAFGVLVHLLVLTLLFKGSGFPFVTSQSVATLVAMVFNYAVNNELTYRDMRLRGMGWVRGLFSFVVACSVGALANVGIASYLFGLDTVWVLSAIAGILVGSVWNYAVTMIYTWRKKPATA
ncbi:MAG: glycosyltransferase [Gammaproteobacteria bacterium]